nr:MAG TPA: tail protein [Caudoviricetes sp.]
MIYEVFIDNKPLYYPGDEKLVIYNSKLEQALNDAGTFEFTITKNNPLYDEIYPRVSSVRITKNDTEIFFGQVRTSEEVLEGEKDVSCVGELSFLYDSIQPQKRYQDYTPQQFFNELVTNHNNQVEDDKKFRSGKVTVTDPNDSLYRFTNFEDTLTDIRDKLCDSLNGYLRIRKSEGNRYIDLLRLEDYGKYSDQPIKFGYNLLDFVKKDSGEAIYTALIPLGARLDESQIDGLDSYLTIESVNGGKNYLKNDAAIKQFGLIWAVQKWDDVTVPENLILKGKEWLRSNQYKTLTLELTAIDMSMLKSDIDSFDLGDTIHVIAKDFGLDAVYPVQKKTTYLQEPEKNTIVLSNTSLSKSYSKKVEGSLQNIEGSIQNLTNSVNSVRQEMPTEKKLLELTTARAESLINIGTHGNVYLVNDGRGYPKELLIMDSQDIGTAKKVWKFADNELKHSITGYNGTYQKVLSDGKVIGECVSGILKDIILENGSLTTPTITDAVIYGGQIHMTGASGNALDVYEGEKGYEINSENINGKNPKGNKTVVLGNTPYGHIELYDESGNVGTMISASMMQTYGVKNRIVKTENYNDRLMYCYESMIPMFSDIGEGAIDETGKCIVYLDDVFIEAVDTECLYQVSLQAYGKGNCWLSKREPNYFVVEGTKDMTFGWEIKAVQRGYVNVRAEQLKREEQQINYVSDTMDYLNECLYSVESEVF